MAMSITNLHPNMGRTDRITRGALGALMLAHGMMSDRKSVWNILERVVGGAFLAYGITGFDPLLSAFGVTTKPGDSNNLINQVVRKYMPGQGHRPMEIQQPVPGRRRKSGSGTVADRLAVRSR